MLVEEERRGKEGKGGGCCDFRKQERNWLHPCSQLRRVDTTHCSMKLLSKVAVSQAGYLDHIHNGFFIELEPAA